MKFLFLSILLLAIFTTIAYCENIKWYDATALGVSGRSHIHDGYTRLTDDVLPKIKEEKMDMVYGLASHCAGLHVDFTTNADKVTIRYEFNSANHMPHMPLTGSHGVDTYIKYNGKWMYFDTIYPAHDTVPNQKDVFIKGNCINLKDIEFLDFSINLPLYEGVKSMQIGIPEGAEITPIRYLDKKPIVVYGTSITQGGCASRPGTCYTSILRRAVDRDVYNLGFSGSGLLEHLMSEILSSYDPEIIIMDCSTNMAGFSDEEYTERYNYFYKTFRAKHPETPIILMEQPALGNYWAIRTDKDVEKGATLRNIYKNWKKHDKNVYIIHAKDLYGDDYEATVDTIHATDLGFYRMSKPVIKLVKQILK